MFKLLEIGYNICRAGHSFLRSSIFFSIFKEYHIYLNRYGIFYVLRNVLCYSGKYYFVTILCVLMVNEFGVMKCKISIISKFNYEIAED